MAPDTRSATMETTTRHFQLRCTLKIVEGDLAVALEEAMQVREQEVSRELVESVALAEQRLVVAAAVVAVAAAAVVASVHAPALQMLLLGRCRCMQQDSEGSLGSQVRHVPPKHRMMSSVSTNGCMYRPAQTYHINADTHRTQLTTQLHDLVLDHFHRMPADLIDQFLKSHAPHVGALAHTRSNASQLDLGHIPPSTL